MYGPPSSTIGKLNEMDGQPSHTVGTPYRVYGLPMSTLSIPFSTWVTHVTFGTPNLTVEPPYDLFGMAVMYMGCPQLHTGCYSHSIQSTSMALQMLIHENLYVMDEHKNGRCAGLSILTACACMHLDLYHVLVLSSLSILECSCLGAMDYGIQCLTAGWHEHTVLKLEK